MEVIIIVYATSVCVGPNYSILVSSIFIEQSIAKESESTSSCYCSAVLPHPFLSSLSMIYSTGMTIYYAVMLMIKLSPNLILEAVCSASSIEDGSLIIKD